MLQGSWAPGSCAAILMNSKKKIMIIEWSQQKQRVGIAYFVPVATRERPVSEGGARENPSVSAAALEWDTSLYPTKPRRHVTLSRHIYLNIRTGRQRVNTPELTEIASGLPMAQKSNKDLCEDKHRSLS